MRKIISFLIIIVLLASPVFAGAPVPGDKAPNFSLSSLKGEKFDLATLKGKVVLVGMFHICVPCMNQAMELNKVRQKIKSDKLVVLGINTSGDSRAAVEDYLNGFPHAVNFPYLLDPEMSLDKAYIQRDMPTVLIIDSEGILKARSTSVGADQLVPYLKKLM